MQATANTTSSNEIEWIVPSKDSQTKVKELLEEGWIVRASYPYVVGKTKIVAIKILNKD